MIPYGPVRSGVFETAQFLVQTGGEDSPTARSGCSSSGGASAGSARSRSTSRCSSPSGCRDLERRPRARVLPRGRVAGPDRGAAAGQAIRRILGELERLYNHLEVTVRECEDASLAVAQAQFAVLKERLHRLAGAVAGNRYLRGVVVPGGTRIDLDSGATDLIGSTLAEWERDWRRVLSILLRTDSFLDRLVSTGPLSEQDARDFACVGPVARGSGIDLDARRDLPYDGYPAFEVAHHRWRRDGAHGGAFPGGRRRSTSSARRWRRSPRATRRNSAPSSTTRRSARPSRRAVRRSTGSRPVARSARVLQAARGVVRELRRLQPGVRLAGADRLLVHRAQPRALPGGVRRMIRWFLRGVSRPRVTTRYPRGEEPPPAGFRARALLDPDAIDQARADARRRVPAGRAGCRGRDLRLDGGRCIGCGLCVAASDDGAVTIDPGYELAARSRERLVVGGAAPKPTRGGDPGRCVPPLAAHPPCRHGVRRRGRTGDRGAAEPLLRHAPARVVLHRQPAPCRRAARHGSGDAPDGGAAAPHLRGDARAAGRGRRRNRCLQREHLDRARGARRGRPGAAGRRLHPGRSAEPDRAAARPAAGSRPSR